MTIGLIFFAIRRPPRERDTGQTARRAPGFTLGLIICILSGLFSSMLNFSFVFGDELRVRALAAGASASMAANPIWALSVTFGFIANAVYCLYLLKKNKTWGVYENRRRALLVSR